MPLILKLGFAYAVAAFGFGFVLGTVRVLLLVPWLGVRWAELIELPIMLALCFVIAGWITRRWVPLSQMQCLWLGFLSLAILLVAETALVLVQGNTIQGYVAGRDPVSGCAYILSLLIFAVMPALVNRKWEYAS